MVIVETGKAPAHGDRLHDRIDGSLVQRQPAALLFLGDVARGRLAALH